MTYRVSLNSIVENLERYCKHVDSLCACYKAEQKKLEKDLQKMQKHSLKFIKSIIN